MKNLDSFIKTGIVPDLLKAEDAYNVIKVIGENSAKINDSEFDIKYSMAYFQKISINEFVMSLSREFDNKSSKNKTRCLSLLIDELIRSPSSFPDVMEDYQTIKQLELFGYNDTIIASLTSKNYNQFTKRLGMSFLTKYANLKTEIETIKKWRDKTLAHNDESNSVTKIVFRDSERLIDFAWEIVTILGWAYLNTAYGFEGKNDLREDFQRKSNDLKTLINRLF